MSEHTKEPWRSCCTSPAYDFDALVGADGTPIFRYTIDDDGLHFDPANARRIVACVNACEGIPTEQLELEKYLNTASYNLRCKAEQQRDELTRQLAEVDRIAGDLQVLCDKQAKRLAECQQDAERYRWIRGRNGIQACDLYKHPREWCTGTALDAAVDAAIVTVNVQGVPKYEIEVREVLGSKVGDDKTGEA